MRRTTAKQRRIRRQQIIGTIIIVVCGTPVALALIIGAALSMAGCASPDVVCTFDWGVAS